MNSERDLRIIELEAFAREEGITLPMPVEMIAYFEKQGLVVCLETGKVYDRVTVQTTSIARAVAYLLAEVEGSIVI